MLSETRSRSPSFLLLFLSLALAVGIAVFMVVADYDWQGMVIVCAAIGVLAVFLIPHLARHRDSLISAKILTAGLVLKLGFAMLRNWTSFVLYGGAADALSYHDQGTLISQNIWRFEFGEVFSHFQWGTSFIEFVTGVIYSVTGPSIYAGYLVYAFLAFLGSYYFYRAFRIAFPEGNKGLYISLIFFFPSILFWPNGIGKDALIFLFLGLFAYGGARLVQGRLQGLLPITIGLVGTLYIRPHIAVILARSFILAFFLPGVGKRPVRVATFVIVLLAVVGLAWLVLPQIASYIGLEEMSPQGLLDRFEFQAGLTTQGGSAFQAIDIKNPLSYPLVMVTLLLRPFPWEAHNALALIQSLEGVLVIILIIWRLKSLGKALASSIANPYTRFLLIYAIAFTIAFAVVANFGIIARQRMMFLPFFFMLLSFTPFRTHSENKALEVPVS
jgi:hypothetical protein